MDATLRNGIVSVPYADTLDARGGAKTKNWLVVSGALPPGLTLLRSGVLSGTPTTAGAYTAELRVTAGKQKRTRSFTITIEAALGVTTTVLASGQVGAPYLDTLEASGGAGARVWSLAAGALPAGLALGADGIIRGTPTVPGTASLTARVTSGTQQAERAFTLPVIPVLTVVTDSLADGVVGRAYADTLRAVGMTGAPSWAVQSGALPAGLTLLASGALAGTPTTAGTSTFTVQVTSGADLATRTLGATIVPALVLTTTSLPNATATAAYSLALAATGGTGTYAWSLAGGTLPAGLTLSAAGVLSGIPSTPSSSSFTIRVTSGTQQVERGFTMLVSSPDAAAVVITTLRDSVELGDSLPLAAEARDAGDVVLPGRPIAWTSLNPAVATVSGTGVVRALSLGAVGIVASTTGAGGGTVSDTAILRVQPRPVDSVEVVPGESSLLIGETLQLATILRDRFGNVLAGRTVTWTSSDAGVAAVDPNTGFVTSGAAGTAEVVAFSEGVTDTAVVRVSRGLILTQVTGGLQHSCGVTEASLIFCWGRNAEGQLGDSSTIARIFPVRVRGTTSYASVTTGQLHSCALTTTNQAYCWGSNPDGRLGTADTLARSTPVAVAGGITFTQLTAGGTHTCGLTAAGVAYCWGLNQNGQLGNNSQIRSNVPVLVAGGHTFTAIVAGGVHTCGIDDAGAAWCWGLNSFGQVGDGTSGGVNLNKIVPTLVSGGRTYAAVGAGSAHTCAIATTGESYCWGQNGSSAAAAAKLGDGTTVLTRTTPTLVVGGLTFTSIAVGGDVTCGRTAGGSVHCWGLNGSGQLGDGTTTHRNVPTALAGGLTWDAFGVGGLHGCAIRDLGRTFCWGQNAQGAIGDGTTTNRTSPVPVRP
ncbi:MAG: putative Ig domain-containing protein [Gemmatimonadaceae bacterium]|nr:putative Ig domain-containing protein [Gemmatimonadaceae bacterium]